MPPAPKSPLRLHRRFLSRVLHNKRDIVVWLPPGYGRARRRHPVVYFQDGQNIFDPLTAFLGNAWHAGDRARELIGAHAIAAPIMVGIYNTGFNRMNEYAPTPAEFSGWDGERCTSTGEAKRYAKFVATELKPFIDARYLTLPGDDPKPNEEFLFYARRIVLPVEPDDLATYAASSERVYVMTKLAEPFDAAMQQAGFTVVGG